MTDMDPFAIEQGGVDGGEEFYLYLNTSKNERNCGRGGRRSNYFNFQECGMTPPDAGSTIDVSLWLNSIFFPLV
jgi:hypothetical protein